MAMPSLLRVIVLAALCASCCAQQEAPSEECLESSTRYDPVNMLGQEKTMEVDAVSCQRRCKSVPGCRHFSFWDDGGCHLQDISATAQDDTKSRAGPPSCEVEQPSVPPAEPAELAAPAAEEAVADVEPATSKAAPPAKPMAPAPPTVPAPPAPTTPPPPPPPPPPTTPPPKPAVPAALARKLSGSIWEPTYFIYLKGPREWQFRAFVGASDGSLVSIHLKDGSLDWTWVPSSAVGAVKLVYHKRGIVVFATADGKVQALAADKGKELWEHDCPSTVLHTIIDIGGSYDGFALICKTHVLYRTIDGETRWQTSATNLKAAWRSKDLKFVCLLSVVGSGTRRLRFGAEDGAVDSNDTVPDLVHNAIVAGDYIEAGDHIVFKDGTDLRTYPICGGKVEALGMTVSNAAQIIDVQDSNDWFGIVEAGQTKIVRLEPDGTLGMTRTETGSAILGPSHGAVYGECGKFCAVAVPKDNGYEIHVKRPDGNLYKTASSALAFDVSEHGNAQGLLTQQLQDSGKFRSFVFTDKKRMLGMEGDKLLWARGSIDTNHAEL